MKKLRVMHGLSEIAGQGIYSVLGLKALGEDAKMVVWMPNSFHYPYDKSLNIDIHKKKFLLFYMVKGILYFIYALFRYNAFHFHFGRSLLLNKDLSVLKAFHKKLFFEFHGSDVRDAAIAYKRNQYFHFPENKRLQKNLRRRNDKICQKADGIILHDYELRAYLPKSCETIFYVPLRINIDAFIPNYPELEVRRVTIVHAPSNPVLKGTEHIVSAVRKLEERHPIDFILVQNMAQDEAKAIYQKADIIVDQLLLGTYGVFAIEGMALGKPVVTYVMDEMLETYPSELPIQSASVETIEDVLERLILSPQLRREIGMAGRKYVEDYHDYRKVAAYLRKIYWGRQACVSSREAFLNVKEMFVQTKD